MEEEAQDSPRGQGAQDDVQEVRRLILSLPTFVEDCKGGRTRGFHGLAHGGFMGTRHKKPWISVSVDPFQ